MLLSTGQREKTINGHTEPRRCRRLRGIQRSRRCCRPRRRDRVLPGGNFGGDFSLRFRRTTQQVLEIQLDTLCAQRF